MKNIIDKMGKQKEYIIYLVKGFLVAYSLRAVFHVPFYREEFETEVSYVIASIYELLGEYDFFYLLFLGLSLLFLRWVKRKAECQEKSVPIALSVLFSLFLLVGRSYHEIGSWGYCFGSPVNFLKFILTLTGYSILLDGALSIVTVFLEKKQITYSCEKECFWSRYGFCKAFAILCIAYLPFLIFAFPGNICADTVWQIGQVIDQSGYSMHHPLVHTFLVGGMTELGKCMFNSYEAGLFCYMLLQLAAMAAALAFTIAVLAKKEVKSKFIWGLLILYCITPVYSNMASTAIKDVPYNASLVGYIVCLTLVLEKPQRLKEIKFLIGFAALQICVILLRNNGIYVVFLSGITLLIFFIKKFGWKIMGRNFFVVWGGSVTAALLLSSLLAWGCDAEPGSKGEMLSLPFQQTAKYLQCYGEEVTQDEKESIEAVLGDIRELSQRYDPSIADPVKACFRNDASAREIVTYLKWWGYGFIKHPKVYLEAFFAHVYGWFSPEISNSIRYKANYGNIRSEGLFPNAEKILTLYYDLASRFTLLGVLENIGLAVWALFFLTVYQAKHGQERYILALIPLWISLLICMASPAFLMHARYGFPILFSMPYLYGFAMTVEDDMKR